MARKTGTTTQKFIRRWRGSPRLPKRVYILPFVRELRPMRRGDASCSMCATTIESVRDELGTLGLYGCRESDWKTHVARPVALELYVATRAALFPSGPNMLRIWRPLIGQAASTMPYRSGVVQSDSFNAVETLRARTTTIRTDRGHHPGKN
jgi:hypothetical protein